MVIASQDRHQGNVDLTSALTHEQLLQLDAHVTPGWQAMADCRFTVDDTWFPAQTHASRRAAAVARCVPCPVRRSCLAYALTEGEDDGVWGGTTDLQRRALLADLADGVTVADVMESATVKPAFLWRR